jgi:hypothetical protein
MQRFDQLDRAALGSILVLSALTALVILRGDQVGVRVRQTTPPASAVNVSTRSVIALAFTEVMSAPTVMETAARRATDQRHMALERQHSLLSARCGPSGRYHLQRHAGRRRDQPARQTAAADLWLEFSHPPTAPGLPRAGQWPTQPFCG